MKVVFLDFDGVLNHVKWRGPGPFNPVCIAYLSTILTTTKAVVVVISSWRNNRRYATDAERLAWLQGLLDGAGMEGEVIDFTSIGDQMPGRADGIRTWLRGRAVEAYVVIDDDVTAQVTQATFVKTSPIMGLTGENAERAIQILNSTILTV